MLKDRLYKDNNGIVAAGPLTKQPYTVPFRLVLRVQQDGNFVVHEQSFREMPEDGEELKSNAFSNGNYFKSTELHLAAACFAERLKKHAEMNYESIYRKDMA